MNKSIFVPTPELSIALNELTDMFERPSAQRLLTKAMRYTATNGEDLPEFELREILFLLELIKEVVEYAYPVPATA